MDLTVAIPTYNNLAQLRDMLMSLVCNTDFYGRILVVNNGESGGHDEIQNQVPHEIDWLNAGENLGWAGGVNAALKLSDTKLFCMMNDDLLFPVNRSFWTNLASWFDPRLEEHIKTGGVGVQSNYIFGYQNMSYWGMPDCFEAPLLIGMLAVYRRDVLGDGLDESLPGGDDYDLSIRVRDQGYELVVDRRCYVHHHGSVTGRKVHGDYWDSEQHRQATYNAIIRKHGVRKYYDLVCGGVTRSISGDWMKRVKVTLEDAYHSVLTHPSDIYRHIETVRSFAQSCGHITEFGVDDGTTTTAFLAARPAKLISYDIERTPEVDRLEGLANGTQFIFKQQDTLAEQIEPTEMLFIDDLHTYEHVRQELQLHASQVSRYMLFHDTELCGVRGGDGSAPGIMAAITEFLRDHDEWRIVHLAQHNNGLMALARVK